MTIKDLLVHVDATDPCQQRINIAHKIASKYQARIAGIYAIPPIYVPIYSGIPLPTMAMGEAQKQQDEISLDARLRFNEIADEWQNETTWLLEEDEIATAIIKHCPHHDLVVVGQCDEHDIGDPSQGVADRVALESGRPTLVVPYAAIESDIGKNIVVAWDGKRESVRAIHDALPFLVAADRVEIVSVNTSRRTDIPCKNITEHLTRHGVAIESKNIESAGRDVSEVLLSFAREKSIDLIVMGAYGHSRFRETLLGGVTRNMLRDMTVSVLMSH